MMLNGAIFRRILRNRDGAMAIETALIAPLLVVMGLGGFEVSQIVSRNSELRTAVAEASAIAIASPPDKQADIDTIEDIIEASTGSGDSNVTLTERFRCDNDATMVNDETLCGTTAVVSSFLEITINDTYSPSWTKFGVGSPVQLSITKTVQVS